MNQFNHKTIKRQGATLLELIATLAITASLMAATMIVLRSSNAAWENHEAELAPAFSQNGVQRHITQNVRQATNVNAISTSSDTSGLLEIQKADGTIIEWSYAGGSVFCSINGAATEPLADDISSLMFTGYESDGTTATTDISKIQNIECKVTVVLPTSGARTISSYAWVRSW